MSQEPPDPGFLYVPLQAAACGVALRLFRDRDGTRCAVGFSTLGDLTRVLGPDQQHYRLTERSIRSLAAERGVSRLIVDPGLVAAPVSTTTAPAAVVPAVVPVAVPQPIEPIALPVPLRSLEPVASSESAWSGWNPQLVGLLVVSAVTGAAALVMQVIS